MLLVEDEDLVRQSLHAILSRTGYQVLQARHPREALFLGQNYAGQIDLVLTDLVMPQMSGSELAERLQCARPGLRVLFISGYGDDPRVRRLLDAGQPFFAKPFSASDIARKVREVLAPDGPQLVPKQR